MLTQDSGPRLTFAGVGSAFTDQRYYQTNMMVTGVTYQNLLVDCGTDARFSLGELGVTNQNVSTMIQGVYISHLHADHIGGLEWLGFCTYFSQRQPKPKLFIVDTLVDDLWNSLKAGMRSLAGSQLDLDSFFEVHAIPPNGSFSWDGIDCKPVQTIHVMDGMRIVPSYGLLLEYSSFTTFLTTDTQICSQLKPVYEQSDVIFHDCETTLKHRSGVHAHYDDLCLLPVELKSKMWLCHYQPDPTHHAFTDGFRGFVKKGDKFSLERSYLNDKK